MTSLTYDRAMDTMDTMDTVDTMDGFDPMDMSYMGNSMPVSLLSHTDYLQPSSGLDMQENLSNFDNEMYIRSGATWVNG